MLVEGILASNSFGAGCMEEREVLKSIMPDADTYIAAVEVRDDCNYESENKKVVLECFKIMYDRQAAMEEYEYEGECGENNAHIYPVIPTEPGQVPVKIMSLITSSEGIADLYNEYQELIKTRKNAPKLEVGQQLKLDKPIEFKSGRSFDELTIVDIKKDEVVCREGEGLLRLKANVIIDAGFTVVKAEIEKRVILNKGMRIKLAAPIKFGENYIDEFTIGSVGKINIQFTHGDSNCRLNINALQARSFEVIGTSGESITPATQEPIIAGKTIRLNKPVKTNGRLIFEFYIKKVNAVNVKVVHENLEYNLRIAYLHKVGFTYI